MFDTDTYRARRQQLLDQDRPASGLVLLLGNDLCPMNYGDNPYPFRQDSTFLYYFGLDVPDLYGIIDLDEGTTTLYGENPTMHEKVWTGDQPTVSEYGTQAGVSSTGSPATLEDHLRSALERGRRVHFLPPYRSSHRHRLGALLGIHPDHLDKNVSKPLIRAVARQRSIKSDEEIAQIEEALDVTDQLHRHAMQNAGPGTLEREIAGGLMGIAAAHGGGLCFRPTCSIHGEVLHNHCYSNTLQENDLLLVDAGASSPLGYASDITRVTPVGGSFTPPQRSLYEAVLAAQTEAIEAIAPGVPFKEIHLHAARTLTEHLIDLGLMHGNAEEAVEAGAHALFFPHGLGHMMGLDVHDMENLGEEYVGYSEDQSRSDQFGLNTLRLARPLRPGFVVTVEPGCYFIPPLVKQWRAEDRHSSYINYEKVEDYLGMGGIRLEDDVLVTEEGARVLGPSLPIEPEDVEALAGEAIKA